MKFKKLFAVVATIAIIVSSAIPAFAGTLGENYGVIPWVPTAPVVDGIMEDFYADGLYYLLDYLQPGCKETGLITECWVVWHGDYLYAYYMVHDKDVILPDMARSLYPWKYDSATFFIDYTGSSYYTNSNATLAQVLQFRIDVSGYQTAYGYSPLNNKSWQAYGSGPSDVASSSANPKGLYATDFFEAAYVTATEGYTVEYKLPLSNKGFNSWGEITLKPGDTFAIGGQVNDDFTGRAEDEELAMYRIEGMDDTIWQAQYWPNVTLGESYGSSEDAEDVEDPETPAEPEAPIDPETPADPDAPTDPETPAEPDDVEGPAEAPFKLGVVGIIAITAAVVAVIAVVVIIASKKKK